MSESVTKMSFIMGIIAYVITQISIASMFLECLELNGIFNVYLLHHTVMSLFVASSWRYNYILD